MSRGQGYRELVLRAIDLIRKEGEVSVYRLVYMFDVSPTKARDILRTAAEIEPRITYDGNRAMWNETKEEEKQ